MTQPVRVLLVDDFEPWRQYVRSALSTDPQFTIVAEAGDGLEAVRKSAEFQPDLILLDISMPGVDGIKAARSITQHAPAARILFLSENRDVDIVEAALQAGGDGYLAKSNSATTLLIAVRSVLKGDRFVSGSARHRQRTRLK